MGAHRHIRRVTSFLASYSLPAIPSLLTVGPEPSAWRANRYHDIQAARVASPAFPREPQSFALHRSLPLSLRPPPHTPPIFHYDYPYLHPPYFRSVSGSPRGQWPRVSPSQLQRWDQRVREGRAVALGFGAAQRDVGGEAGARRHLYYNSGRGACENANAPLAVPGSPRSVPRSPQAAQGDTQTSQESPRGPKPAQESSEALNDRPKPPKMSPSGPRDLQDATRETSKRRPQRAPRGQHR